MLGHKTDMIEGGGWFRRTFMGLLRSLLASVARRGRDGACSDQKLFAMSCLPCEDDRASVCQALNLFNRAFVYYVCHLVGIQTEMKNLFGIVVVVALGVGGYMFWTQYQADDGGAGDTEQVSTASVERRDIQFSVSAAGEIGPAEQVSVRPEINGRIASLLVDIGDRVKKGDVLLTLDDQELRNERDSARTDIDRSKLQLAQATRNFERARELFEEKLISQEEFENYKTELDLAQNSLNRSESEFALIEERLTKTQILAPFDCTVLARPVSVGQAVSGSGGVGGGTEVLAIADLNQMIIQAHINQADVTRLRVDQVVDVQVEAVPGLNVEGRVERIAPQATIKNNIKGFLARILLRNVDPLIRPGMTANIKIPVATAADVLAVPLSAVFTEYNQELGRMERFAYVRQGGKFQRRLVQIGLSDFFHAEIQQGLSDGDKVSLGMPPPKLILPHENLVGGAPSSSTSNGNQAAQESAVSVQTKAKPAAAPAKPRNTSS